MADDMADSNAVGINEMFRRLRSANLSHVADSFISKWMFSGLLSMACTVREFKFTERTLFDAHLQSENKLSVQLMWG